MTRAETFYSLGLIHSEHGEVLADRYFTHHADWQNYLAGVRAAVV